jgi:hypothetical protein
LTTCLLGASVAPGHNPNAEIVISRSLWETLTGTASSWLDPILDTFTPSIVKVSDLCTLNVDDPGDLSLTTIAGAFARNPFSLLEVEVWAKNKLSYLAFQANCVCNASSSTCDSLFGRPIPALPNSAVNGVGTYTKCMWFHCTNAADFNSFAYGQLGGAYPRTLTFRAYDLTAGTQLWSQSVVVPDGGYHEVTSTTPVALVAGHDYAVGFDWPNGMGFNYIATGWGGASGSFINSNQSCDNYPSGTGQPTRLLVNQAVPVQPIVCAGATTPPAPTTPVQPPDLVLPPAWSCGGTTDICTRLQQISDRLDWLRTDVTLIQRQHVPFAYLHGTTYAGLTGHGSITVQGILGVAVSLTTVPSGWGRTSDTPRRLIPAAGQLLFSTADGDGDPTLLHYDTELVLGVSGAVTSVKYSLRPGIVASLTTLVREP